MMKEYCVIIHSGIKDQKWGQRRYQNPDGTYTELGKERRRVGFGQTVRSIKDRIGEGSAARAAKRAEKKEKRDATKMPRNPRRLTDAQLADKIGRLINENRYKVLRDPSHYKLDTTSSAAVKIIKGKEGKKAGGTSFLNTVLNSSVRSTAKTVGEKLGKKAGGGIYKHIESNFFTRDKDKDEDEDEKDKD